MRLAYGKCVHKSTRFHPDRATNQAGHPSLSNLRTWLLSISMLSIICKSFITKILNHEVVKYMAELFPMELLTVSMSCCFGRFKPSPHYLSWGLSSWTGQYQNEPRAKTIMKIRVLQNHLWAHVYKKANEGWDC